MNSRGFTLIELLVIVTVAGILITAVIANLNASKIQAYNARALACARSIRTAEIEQQTRQNAFTEYQRLEPGTIRACAFLTQPPPGRQNEQHYQFAVRHPQGNRTILVSDQDLRWTYLSPRADLIMSDATPFTTPPAAATPAPAPATPAPALPAPVGTETLVISYWEEESAAQRSAVRRLSLTAPDGRDVPLSFTPSGSFGDYLASMAVFSNLTPGTYRLTAEGFNTCFDDQIGISMGAVCNRTPGVTRSVMDINVSGSYTNFAFSAGVALHTGYADFNSIHLTPALRDDLLARNIRGVKFTAVSNTADPTRTDCAGNCTDTDPTWKSNTIWSSSEVGWDGVLPPAISLSSITGTVLLARYLPVDDSQPMNTAGLPTERNFILSNTDAQYVLIRPANLGGLMNLQKTLFTDHVTTNYGSGITNPWLNRPYTYVDPL